MAHRTFTDRFGRLWDVWDVQPTMTDRRAARQGEPFPAERRKHPEMRPGLPVELRRGWLAFESKVERRRLAPIPAGWDQLPDTGLGELLDRATARRASRRLIE